DRNALPASRPTRARAAVAHVRGRRRAARAQAAICYLCRDGARARPAGCTHRAAGSPSLFDSGRARPSGRRHRARIGAVDRKLVGWVERGETHPTPASLALDSGLVQGHGGANESLQRVFVYLLTLAEVDGTPCVALKAGVEEA